MDPKSLEAIDNELDLAWLSYLTTLEYAPKDEELPRIFHSWTSGYILRGDEDLELFKELNIRIKEHQEMIEKLNLVIVIQANELENNKKELKKLKKK